MSDEIIQFLTNPSNILAIFFFICTIVVSIYAIFKQRWPPRPVYQDRAYGLIEKDDSTLSEKIHIGYESKAIPRLNQYFVIFWNSGDEPLLGINIQEADKLRFEFCNDAEVLSVRDLGEMAPTVQFDYIIEENIVLFTFNTLEKNEGVKLEILHTGSDWYPEIKGRILGIPKGFKYLGKIPITKDEKPHIPERLRKYKFLYNPRFYVSILAIYCLLAILSFFMVTIPYFNDPNQLMINMIQFGIFFIISFFCLFGILLVFSIIFLVSTRKRYPRELQIETI